MARKSRSKNKSPYSTDRRAGRIPHVGKVPRSRTKSGRWRKKRSDAGKPRGPRKKKKFLGLF